VALLLSGIGFGVLSIGGALRNPDTAFGFAKRFQQGASQAPAVPLA
jgi:hypothetical protein